MNDTKELLQFAAKAAGIVGTWQEPPFAGIIEPVLGGADMPWNPLQNDGQALRLAVKLDIEFYQADDEGRASYAGYWTGSPSQPKLKFCIEYHNDINNMGDPYKATRLAIVRAAAEIGKTR